MLRVGLPQQPNTLNPLIGSQFYENYIDEALYSGLTVIGDRGEVNPDLAEAVPTRDNGGISRDGRTIVYHLRPNLRWQDGVPLTAEDVAFTFARIRDPRTGFPATSTYDIVTRVSARDARTVIVRLRRPSADAVAEIFVNGQNGSIVPKHLLDGSSDLNNASFNQHPVGSGPYAFVSWQRGAQLVLSANPLYFRGKPRIDRLRVEFIPDAGTIAVALRAGELDFAPVVTPTAVQSLRGSTRLRIYEARTLSLTYLVYRLDRAPFDDVRLRRAMALVVDRDALVQRAFLGHAAPASELLPPWSPFATIGAGERPNPGAAGVLLDAAGWHLEDDGIRTKGGKRLQMTLTTIAGSRTLVSIAVQLQAAWKAIGVDVSLRPVESNVIFAPDGIGARGDFSILLSGYGFGTTPDRSSILSSESVPPAGQNYARYRSAEVDGEIKRSRLTFDPSARQRIFARIATRVRTDLPYVPIAWADRTSAAVRDLSGLRPEPINSDFWNVYDWR